MKKYLLLIVPVTFLMLTGYAQPGKNGNVTITTTNTVVNTYSRITVPVPAGATTVTVNNVTTDLGGVATGDLIMLYQAQGAQITTTDDNNYGTVTAYNGAGTYEFAFVASVAGNVITLGCGTKQAFSVTGRSQVIKVPQYNNLTINAGRSIVPVKWNGATGGIVVVHVAGTLTNNGTITSDAAGFRGGKRDNLTTSAGAGIMTIYRSTSANDGAEKGEGIVGYQADYDGAGMGGRYGRGAPANGGGGGNGHNAAGGGGANGNNGQTWTGAGVMDPNPLYLAAWKLDPDYVSNGNALTNSSGGGRGGYTYAANNADAFSTALSSSTWGGDYRDPVGGRGGRPLTSLVESRIFLGGGGGAGDGNNNASADGGDGGGITYVVANTIAGTGNIAATGQNGWNTVSGHNDAPGGGGGGGTIVIKAFSFTGQALNANGGAGGNQLISGNESEGCGGGGGGGVIAVPTSGIGSCGVSNSYTYIYGTNGTSTSASVTEFPPNGGTWGASGQNDVPVSPYFIPYTITCLIDADADGVNDPTVDLDDDNDGISDILESYGGVDPSADADNDFAPNYADPSFVPYLDANCDGINDYFDFDLDGIPDFIDLDSDNDGITDCLEAGGNDTNKDGIVDGFADADGNGLSDALGTGLVPGDLDGDGLRSFRDRDSDGDGITDCIEAGGTDANGDGVIDGFADTDKDGYANNVDPTTNRLALTAGNTSGSTPLTVADTDSDTKRNFLDIDSDNDGIPDNVEAQTTAGYVAPVATDTDSDGIANNYDTTPLVPVNTDGADVPDYTDPDSDNDGVADNIEGHDADFNGTPTPALPVTGDADGDGLLDGYDLATGANSTTVGMGGNGASAPLQNTDGDAQYDWRDTDDDNDCILTSSVGENTNSNTSWADDFSQGGAPRPNYLFASNTLAAAGAVRCGTGTVTLNATSLVSGTFRWYDAATGGTLLQTTTAATSSNYTTPSLPATTTYYVSFDNGCVTPRQAVTATIVSASSTPTGVPASRCGTGTVTLSASSGASGTFRWYTASTGGTLLQTTTAATTSNYTTPAIAATTTYYVEFDNGTCVSARAAVTATIATPPTVTGTGGATCGGPTATLSASAPSAGTFTWYDAATGGNLLYTQSSVSTSTFTTPAITSTTTYYVSFTNGTCATTSRTAVTATVTSAAVAPAVTNAAICAAGTATLSATSSTAGTFRWYAVATGGTPLKTDNAVTTSSYTTPSISVTTDYYVEFASATCTSARVKVTANVVAASITAINASRCGNGTVTVGASSPIAGTFTWYDAATGGNLLFTSAAGSTSSSYTTPSLTTTTTYYVALTTTSPSCGPTTRIPVTATIASSPTLTATAGAACNPGTVALSASSGGTTGTFRWYAASNGGTPLQTTASATSSSFTTPFISTTTDYYVEFDNGACVTTPRTVVRASIVGNTELTTTDASICPGNTAQLLASSMTSGTFTWYDAASGGTVLQNTTTGLTDTYTTPTLAATTTYYVSLTTTTPACTSARYPVTANVFPNTPPTGTGATRCGTGTVTLTATSSQAGTFRWYTAASGGSLLQTNNNVTASTYTTPSISATTNYYVEFSNGTCTSARTTVTAGVNSSGSAPAAPTAPNVGRCSPGTVNLVATSASTGTFRWWSAATAGTLLFTTTGATTSTYTTPSLATSTTYYVEFANATCTSTRTAVTAQINIPPPAPTATDQSRCGDGMVLLTATASTSGTFRWYSVASGGAALQTTAAATSSSFTTPILATTTTYYVEFDNGTCPSAPRTAVQAIVNGVPAQPTGTNGSRCGTGSVVLSAQSATSGTFRWYTAASGGPALATSASTSVSTFNTPSIAATTTYYVEYDNGTCTSTRTAVQATVVTPPAAPAVTPGSRCGTGTVNLSASSSAAGTFRWYTAATGGTLLETDAATTTSAFTTPSLSSTLTYYVEFDNGTCGSTRTAVTAAVNTFPVISGTSAACAGVAGNGTITVTASISAGTLEYSSNGTTFQASSTLTGLANGTYTVYTRETTTLCTTSQAGVVVTCNVPPNAVNDNTSTNEDTPVNLNVTTNDTDVDGTINVATVDLDPTTAGRQTTFSNAAGNWSVSNAGVVTYTPALNFNGTATVSYTINDNGGATSNSATHTVTVNAVNDAPVAVGDNTSTNEDLPVTINVTANDTDVDGTVNTATVDLNPAAGIQSSFTNAAGSWSVNTTGDVTYTPALNFTGNATLSYTVNDNSGAKSNAAAITVSVAAVNDAPVAVADNPTTNEDTPVTFNVTTNDTDVDGTIDVATVDLDPASAGRQTTFSNAAGSWSVDNTGDVTYTPTLNFNGGATLSYSVDDNSGATSAPGTITVTVTPVNDAPVAINDNTSTNEETPVTVNVTPNDTDVDGTINVATVDLDPATAGRQTTFSNADGNWSVSNAGVVTYTPALNVNGTATVSYTVNDNSGATSNTATLTISVAAVNDAPVAVNDNASTNEDTPVSLNVTTNDTDIDGTIDVTSVDLDPATAGIQTTFSNAAGSWSVSNTGVVTYSPTVDFNGTATVNYTVNDNTGATSNAATLTITVSAVNDAPVAIADNPTTQEDTPVTFSVTANDTDVDGTIDVTTVDLDPATAGRQTSFSNAAGSWNVSNTGDVTYIPTLNFNGSATLSYTVNDNSGATSNAATMTVNVVAMNDAPVAVADNPTTNEDTPVTFNVTTNDTDVDGTINIATVDLDPATAGIQTTFTTTDGSWSVNNAGNVTFTPVLNFNGIAATPYTVNDNSGAMSNAATISVTVTPVNDAPVAVNDNASTNEDTPVSFNVTTNDTDMDGTINAATVDLDPTTAGRQTTFSNAAGNWSVSNTGVVTYTPALNFNGTATVSYTVNDNGGATSNSAIHTVTVNAVNDAPVAVNDATSTNEDTPVTINITANDTDVDGTVNVATVDLSPAAGIQSSFTNAAGSWSVNNTGDVTYTPTLNFTGNATLSYTVNDNSGAKSNAATITVTVAAVNDAPVAVADNPTTNEDTPVTFNVTTNDTDVDGTIDVATVDLDPATAGRQTSFTSMAGNWSVDNSGNVTYTPALNVNGSAAITYTVNDNSGTTSAPGTITVTVTPVNDAPVAINDNTSTNEDIPVTFTVTTNDTDVDGTINVATVDLDPATAGRQTAFSNAAGSWSVSNAGVVTYTPTLNFNGTATVSYTVNDNSGATSNTATLTISVAAVNDAPVAVNDNASINEDTPVGFNVTTNDTDADGTIDAATVDLDPATAGIQTNFTSAAGSWSVSNTGNVTFTPALNFNGAASITYTVNDNNGLTSNAATITVTVNAVNDAPIAVADTPATNEDTPATFDVTANDTDVDGTIDVTTVDLDPATAGIQNTFTSAAGTWSADNAGSVTFTPVLNFNGTATVTYTVNDNNGLTSAPGTISVTVTPVNDAPVAVNDNAATNEDTPATFNVTGNDTDADGTINAATVDLDPATAGIQATFTSVAGVWSVSNTGTVTYTPTLNFNGTASITYTVNDNSGATSNAGTITGTVTPVNDAPVAIADIQMTNEDTQAAVNVTTNDTDVDGTIDVTTVDLDPTTAGRQTNFTNAAGNWSVSNTGIVTYTPMLNFNGTATVAYTVNDNSGATSNTATLTITVNPVNDAPVAVNDNASTNEDTPVTYNVTTNDTDVDGTINAATVDLDPATAGIQTTFTNAAGNWAVSNSGVVTYTPTLNFNGPATANYTVNDNSGATSNAATFTVSVTAVNDAPVAVNDNTSTNEDTPATFNVTTNDTDVDGTINAATVDLDPAIAGIQTTFTSAAGSWNVNNMGNVTFTPVPNFNGVTSITYTVNDNNGLTSNAATIAVTVNAVNDAPIAVADTPTTNEDTPATFDVTTNDTDADGTIDVATVDLDPVTAGIQTTFASATGAWSVNNTGNVTYTPTLNFNGTATITYTVNDDSGATSNTATITVTVNPVNDAPVAIDDNASTNEDTPASFNVTTNDTDVDGTINAATVDLDPATAGIQTTFTNAAGSWDVNNSGVVTLTPTLNFNGTAAVSYAINDNSGATSNAATLTINVVAVNDAPVAVNDNASTNEDTPITFNVTTNDTDVDGPINAAPVDLDPATAGIQTTFTSAAGAWSVNNTGDVTFTPALNFNGTATTTYTVNDNSGATSNTAIITVTVNSVNDAPIAVNDNATTNEDTPVSFNVTTNDTDADGTINVATVDLDPTVAGIQTTFTNAAGDWSVSSSGIVTYTPILNFNGTASVSYTVNDNGGATSNTATLAISVAAVNDLPVAVNDNVSTNEDTPATFNVTTNDTDVDGAVNIATVDLDPVTAGRQTTFTSAAGSWNVDNAGNVTYTPTLNSNGSASITYTVNDNSGATSNPGTISVTITPVNDAPVAVADNPTTNEDTPATFSVTANDTDMDGTINAATVDLDPATAGVQTTFTSTAGSWSVNNTGNVTFTPVLNFNGVASITYTVNDNNGLTSNAATIAVTVNAVNDAPIAVADTPTANEDTPATFDVTANDTDVDGTIDVATVDLDPATAGIQNTFTSAAGAWSADNAGNVTFTPVLNFNGTATISYTVNDNNGLTSAPGAISVTVTPINDTPVAVNDNASTNEDTPATYNVTTNDTDVDGTINAATVDLDPTTAGRQTTFANAAGSWGVSNAGVVTYTPTLNFNGPAAVSYTVNDNSGATSNTATLTVNVVAVNDAPVAVNDNASTNEDTPATFNVTTNDTDVDGTINAATVDLDPAIAGIQTTFTSAAGSWNVNNMGNVTFTPVLNFNGVTSITYTVNDNNGLTSNVATIAVTINAVNDTPTAVADIRITNEDTPATFDVTANDTDADGTIDVATVDLDPATAGIQTTFSNAAGSWSVNNTGDVTYTPALNFNGTAIVTYTVNDNGGATSNAATISVAVASVNDAPVAVNDNATTNEDTPATFSVTTNDTDVDGTIDVATVDLDPAAVGRQTTFSNAAGSWSVSNAGDVTFTPVLNFNGMATVAYTVNDNSGATSNTATLTVAVNPVNDAPVAINDNASTNEDTPAGFNVTTNDTDVDGTVNVATVDLDPVTAGRQTTFTSVAGSWSVDNAGNVTYTPTLNFNGPASITYTVNDNSGATSTPGTISVTVTPVNDAPVAVADNPTTNEDTPVTFSVTANDTDVDGTINAATVDLDPATAGIQTTFTSAAGAWSVSNTGDVTFTPVLNFNGPATNAYTVNDNSGETSNTTLITVTVTPVNDAPVAINDNATTNEDTPATFNVTGNDTDADGPINAATVDLDPATAGIQTTFTSAAGAWSVNNTGDVTFTPILSFNGPATTTYTVNDNSGAASNAATIAVTVTPVNDAPAAVNDNAITNEDTFVTFNITGNDTDIDGTIDAATVDLDPATAGIQNTFTSAAGTWSVSTTGNVTFTPVLNFNGPATITYTVNDNHGVTSNAATITVTVNPVNDAPVANNDTPATNEDTPVTFNVTTNDADVDGTIDVATADLDPATAGIQTTFTSPQGTWNVSNTGNVTYTPTLNFNGTASITYTVNDNNGLTSNAATIAVTVHAVNDTPVAVNDNTITDEDTPVTLGGTSNDTDADGSVNAATIDFDQTLSGIQQSSVTAQGTWSTDASGNVTFTPVLNFNGTASQTYTVNDNNGATSNLATITIIVNPVNDAPVAVNDAATTIEDTPTTFNVTGNDTDVDGTVDATTTDLDPATAGIQNAFLSPAGSWSVDAAGNVTYTPVLNFNGHATLTYTVQDNDGATSIPGVISITVQTINDIPVAVADNFTTDEDMPATASIIANDTDPDGTIEPASIDLDPATAGIQQVVITTAGTWTVNPAGQVTFTPALNFNGTAGISYHVQDDEGAVSTTVSAVFTVNPVNDTPVLADKDFAATQGMPITGNLLTGDSDPDGTVLSVTLTPVTPPTHGTLTLTPDGNFTYTPDADYTGPDAVEIQVCDAGLPAPAACATMTITFNVVDNQSPVVSNKTPQTDEDVILTGTLLGGGDRDPEGTALVVNPAPAQAPAHGTIVIRPDGSYTYTPARDYNGQDSVKVEICDGNPLPACTTMTVHITIHAVNDAPVLNTGTISAVVNGTVSGNTLTGDEDPEGTGLVVGTTPVSGPLHGTIEIASDGQFHYTPAPNFIGIDTIVFEVCDQGLPLPAVCANDTLLIVVSNPNGEDVYIPEGFSPNGDGVNDSFVIGYNGSESIQLEVYNRWGNPIYKNHNYQNDWRGEAMYGIVIGTEVPDGTYFYKVRVGSFQKVKSFTIQR